MSNPMELVYCLRTFW